MRKNTVSIVKDLESMVRQGFVSHTSARRILQSQAKLYEEQLEKLAKLKSEAKSRAEISRIQYRFNRIREAQIMALEVLKDGNFHITKDGLL